MNFSLTRFLAAASVVLGCAFSFAQDATTEPTKPQITASVASNTVGEALSKIKFVHGTPKTDADYYIYLYSASWCGPCRKIMPAIIKEYEAIKKDGRVELILIGADSGELLVKKYAEKYNMPFAATWVSLPGVVTLPGNQQPRGIPAAIIVDKSGKVLQQGFGGIILSWKQFTINKP